MEDLWYIHQNVNNGYLWQVRIWVFKFSYFYFDVISCIVYNQDLLL